MGDNKQSEIPSVVDSSAAVVVSKKNHKGWHKKPDLIIASLVILVLVIIGVANQIHKHDTASTPPSACSGRSGNALLGQAASVMYDQSVQGHAKLKQAITKIQALPGYKLDPNCLYVVTQYYINATNVNQANTYYADFNKVYNPKQGLSKTLTGLGASVKSLNGEIMFLHNLQIQAKKDVRGS